MVAGLGGPADFLERAEALLPRAPVVRDVPAPDVGTVAAIDTRGLGLVVVLLGGGRRHPAQPVDPAVGLDGLQPLGARLERGDPLARVHAASAEAAAAAVTAVQAAYRLDEAAPAATPTVIARMDAAAAAGYEGA
jgi:thymidine phosphorylase